MNCVRLWPNKIRTSLVIWCLEINCIEEGFSCWEKLSLLKITSFHFLFKKRFFGAYMMFVMHYSLRFARMTLNYDVSDVKFLILCMVWRSMNSLFKLCMTSTLLNLFLCQLLQECLLPVSFLLYIISPWVIDLKMLYVTLLLALTFCLLVYLLYHQILFITMLLAEEQKGFLYFSMHGNFDFNPWWCHCNSKYVG